MRKFYVISALGLFLSLAPAIAQADIYSGLLIGWDSAAGTNFSVRADGVSGHLYTTFAQGPTTDANSTDGTFGSEFSGAATDVNWAIRIRADDGEETRNNRIGIQISNNSSYDLILSKIHFDAARHWLASPDTITVLYASGNLGISNDTVIQTIMGLPQLGGQGGLIQSGYGNYDVSFTNLADYTLSPGQSALFRIEGSDAPDTWADTIVDNIGISGTIIPEPMAGTMMAFGALAVLALRRMLHAG